MDIFNKQAFLKIEQDIIKRIKSDAIFIYPTDTIYGVGAIWNEKNIERINKLKKRKKPLSVIVPSKEWIRKNCVVDEKYLKYLPGKYTLIVKYKEKTLGVRIIDHWFQQTVKKINKPIITTSANITNNKPMTDLNNIPFEVDFIIYEGKIEGKPSTIINTLTGKIINR